jgi:hypothetical protein
MISMITRRFFIIFFELVTFVIVYCHVCHDNVEFGRRIKLYKGGGFNYEIEMSVTPVPDAFNVWRECPGMGGRQASGAEDGQQYDSVRGFETTGFSAWRGLSRGAVERGGSL